MAIIELIRLRLSGRPTIGAMPNARRGVLGDIIRESGHPVVNAPRSRTQTLGSDFCHCPPRMVCAFGHGFSVCGWAKSGQRIPANRAEAVTETPRSALVPKA
jgi:hypothetical protein